MDRKQEQQKIRLFREETFKVKDSRKKVKDSRKKMSKVFDVTPRSIRAYECGHNPIPKWYHKMIKWYKIIIKK